jgi:hypothetical protein
MTVSRSRGLFFSAVAACVLWQGTAVAQSTGPKVLRPGARTVQPAQAAQSNGVQVNQLDAPGRVAAGVLREEDGGLPADLWLGSERSTIAALLDRMPGHYSSPAARDLARRLLLSAGSMPAGQPDDSQLLAHRMTLVLTLGDAESAVSLAEAAGGGAPTPAVAWPLAEALFALGETDRACDTVQGQLRIGGRDYWQRASVFCDIRGERLDAAELTLSLLTETGEQDPVFRKLANALLDETSVDIEATPDMSALDTAMIAAAKSAVVRKIDLLPPHLAVRLSSESAVVNGVRIESGVSAVRSAGMSPALIMLMFGNAAGDPGAPYRNHVVTAMSATTGIVRAEALNDLWTNASQPENQATAAAFAQGFLRKLQPEAGLAFLAPAAFRMNLLNGEVKRAESWLTALRRNATAGNTPLSELARAQVLARLAGMKGVDDRALGLWLDSALSLEDRTHAMTVLLALDALGDPAGPALWRRVLADGSMASSAVAGDLGLWRQLVMSAGGGRMGEAISAALALVGSAPAASIDPIGLATIAGSLRRLGLETQARRLVVEAVIGQGG